MSKVSHFDDLIQIINQRKYPKHQDDIDKYWQQLIYAYENYETECSWCCLDYIGTITTENVISFFQKLAYSGRDWYSRELAIYWLKNYYPEVINKTDFSRVCLDWLRHTDDKNLQRVALSGIRYFGTDESKAKVWQIVYEHSNSTQSDQHKQFSDLVNEVLKDPNYMMTHHLIPIGSTNK